MLHIKRNFLIAHRWLVWGILYVSIGNPTLAMNPISHLETSPELSIDDNFFEKCKKLGKSPNDFLAKDGSTVLMIAVKAKQKEHVQTLIKEPNFKINAQDNEGNTALHHGALNADVEMVQTLLAVPGIEAWIKNKNKRTARDEVMYKSAHIINDNEAIKYYTILQILHEHENVKRKSAL
jgi:ankyrin repeat protein